MKLVFVHTASKVKKDNFGNFYTDGSYNEDIWNMYLKVFSEITIVMREDENIYSENEALGRFNRIPLENITFLPIPNQNKSIREFLYSTISNNVDNIIETAVKDADAVIVRLPGNSKVVEYARKYGKKCLVELVGCPLDSLWYHSFKGKILAPYKYLKMRNTIKTAPNVIYVTESFLQRRYPTIGKNIACSDVRLRKIDDKELSERINYIENNDSNIITLGTASGLGVKYKGQQYVIKAISELKKEGHKNFKYHIVGAGDSSYLKKIIKKYDVEDSIIIGGSISHASIFKWYKDIDVYIQPSETEGLPRSLVEAMSCAVPCVASKVGGVPELLDESAMFSRGSIKEIKILLLNLLDKGFRKNNAKRCFARSKSFEIGELEDRRIRFMKSVFGVK